MRPAKGGRDEPDAPSCGDLDSRCPDALGTYYGVIFRFKAQDDLGGALGLLWDKLDGAWKISSYAIIEY